MLAPALVCASVVGIAAAHLAIASPSSPTVVLCLGDSLTEGFGVSSEHSFPARLERRLRESGHPGVRVVNAGISGSTSASGESRLRWQLRADPSVLVLALGANDGLRGIDLASTRENLSKTITLAKQNGVTVLLAGMKIPPNYGPVYAGQFESLFPELAREHDVALIPFLLEGVAAQPALNLPDGVHPNAKGYERVTENVLEHLLPLLPEAGSSQQ